MVTHDVQVPSKGVKTKETKIPWNRSQAHHPDWSCQQLDKILVAIKGALLDQCDYVSTIVSPRKIAIARILCDLVRPLCK